MAFDLGHLGLAIRYMPLPTPTHGVSRLPTGHRTLQSGVEAHVDAQKVLVLKNSETLTWVVADQNPVGRFNVVGNRFYLH